MYHSILLAADGSEYSYSAAEGLLHFIGEDSQVTILHVVDADASKTDVLHGTQGRSLTDDRKKKLQELTDMFDRNSVNYSIRLEHGTPNKTVVKVANSGEYQAVILGTRGLNNLQEMMLGSVIHKVEKRANIPDVIEK